MWEDTRSNLGSSNFESRLRVPWTFSPGTRSFTTFQLLPQLKSFATLLGNKYQTNLHLLVKVSGLVETSIFI